MSSEKKAAAGRANAARSTGPRSAAGKARSAKNALAHGLCSAAPVVPGEPADGWERHRSGVVTALAPAGGLEEALADRVAACLWRLRRVAAYEAAVTAAGLEAAAEPPPDRGDDLIPDPDRLDRRRLRKLETKLAEAREDLDAGAGPADLAGRLSGLAGDAAVPGGAVQGLLDDLNGALPGNEDEYFDFDDAALRELGVPAEYAGRPFEWLGWTAGAVRAAARLVAAEFGVPADDLLAGACADRLEAQRDQQEQIDKLEAEAAGLRARVEARRRRAVLRAALPDGATLDKLSRYEAHLSRQLLQAMNTLERLQAARAGRDVPPPAAGMLVVEPPVILPVGEGG